MSLINFCILLLCIQPLVIYKGMFGHKEKEDKSELEFQLSFLVIAPSFIFFYLDTFGYALLLLGGVSVVGIALAKIFEHKAKRSLPLQDLCTVMVAWLIIFSVGYGAVNLWAYIGRFLEAPVSGYTQELSVTELPMADTPLVKAAKGDLLFAILPSLGYLAAMAGLFLIKLYEIRTLSRRELSEKTLLVLSVAAAILPLFSEYYLWSLIFNFVVFVKIGGGILTYKETDPSAGAIGIFYTFVFIMSVGFSLMYKAVIWLLSF